MFRKSQSSKPAPIKYPLRNMQFETTRNQSLSYLYLISLFTLLLLLSGCASLPTDYPRTESSAYQDHLSTSLGKSIAQDASQHPGKSGFTPIRYGNVAFTSRLTMTLLAEKTLDLQYYLWEPGETGRIFADYLVRAADRGVRVRLLLDDMGTAGRDAAIASLNAHPNIEIRIFNPFANRKSIIFDFLTDFDRVNHRMHNKIMVADNSFAIVGGRNIGDHYFAVDPETNFRDLDIAAAGPIVRDISHVFDRFWGGDWAIPIDALADRPYTKADLDLTITKLRKMIAEGSYPYSVDDDVAVLKNSLSSIQENLIWAPGKIVWDDPSSIEADDETGVMVEALFKRIQSLENDLTIESAYFVVGNRGVEAIQKLHDRGVTVRILTNSLASNDVVAAHAGHAKYRKQLLQAGATIFEVRPDSGIIKKNWSGDSKAGLHTKALVFDRKAVFIGSFNLDPRSANINTEAGLYVESPEMAEKVLAYMDEGVKPENSYQVLLDEKGHIYWVTEDEGVEVRYDKEPKSSFSQRFMSGLIQILPVESQL